MLSWLLEVVNGGVVDNSTTGSNSPDGYYSGLNSEMLILLLIVFVIGILIGYGIRSFIQAYKNAPNDKNENQKSEK